MKTQRHEPILIPTVFAAGTGATLGVAYEGRRQYYLRNTTAENADKFIKNIENIQIKEKYGLIRKYITDGGAENLTKANKETTALLKSSAMFGAGALAALYLTYRLVKPLLVSSCKHSSKDPLDNIEN